VNPQSSEMPPAGWKVPLPYQLARPTYWPAMLALGTTLLLLGFVTLLPVALVGLALSAAALIGWIRELIHE